MGRHADPRSYVMPTTFAAPHGRRHVIRFVAWVLEPFGGPGSVGVSARTRTRLSGLVVAAAMAASVTPALGATTAGPANRVPGTIAFSGAPASGASPVSQIYEARPDGSVRQLTHDRRGLVAA